GTPAHCHGWRRPSRYATPITAGQNGRRNPIQRYSALRHAGQKPARRGRSDWKRRKGRHVPNLAVLERSPIRLRCPKGRPEPALCSFRRCYMVVREILSDALPQFRVSIEEDIPFAWTCSTESHGWCAEVQPYATAQPFADGLQRLPRII